MQWMALEVDTSSPPIRWYVRLQVEFSELIIACLEKKKGTYLAENAIEGYC